MGPLVPDDDSSSRRGARALLIDGDVQQSRSAVRALRAAIEQVDAVASADQASCDAHFDLIVVNYGSLDAETRHGTLRSLAEHNARQRLIIYSANYTEEGLNELLAEHGVTHALACAGSASDMSRLRITAAKSLKSDIFGVEKYLGWGAWTQHLSITSSPQRRLLADACSELADRVGLRERRAQSLATLADELLTNALYNAPTDRSGNPRFRTLDRNLTVALEPGEVIDVVLAVDTDNVAVSVSDPFGSVTSKQLIAALGRCMATDARRPRPDPGGAGLGLFHAYRSSSQLAFNIAPGLRTEAIGLLDIKSSNREFQQRPKSLDVFEAEPTER